MRQPGRFAEPTGRWGAGAVCQPMAAGGARDLGPVAGSRRDRALVAHRNDQELLPPGLLAILIGVHVRTLRNAARDGRLSVTYDTRTTFRRLRAHATPADARVFRQSYYGRTVRTQDRRPPLTWSTIPPDYDLRIRTLRQGFSLSQARFGELVGAASKAVVYQWESRRRCPSPVFWQRIEQLYINGRRERTASRDQ